MQRAVAISFAAMAILIGGRASASPEFVPDLNSGNSLANTSTFRAHVSEQARVEVPPLVVFNVTNVAMDTPQDGAAVIRVVDLVLAPNRKLLVTIAPQSDAFSDVAGQTSWSASKVTWSAVGTQGAVVRSGRLAGASAYVEVMTCSAGLPTCSATLKFVLEADESQLIAGTHTLVGVYRVSSVL